MAQRRSEEGVVVTVADIVMCLLLVISMINGWFLYAIWDELRLINGKRKKPKIVREYL